MKKYSLRAGICKRRLMPSTLRIEKSMGINASATALQLIGFPHHAIDIFHYCE